MKQHHGIQVGDLVKYKHTMFEAGGEVHLVAEAWTSKVGVARDGPSTHIVLHGHNMQHRAKNFVVISRGRK
tara:strand:- start:245 stop:457 length:213 start_codon:yes stop_codon:yes gene_type:complete